MSNIDIVVKTIDQASGGIRGIEQNLKSLDTTGKAGTMTFGGIRDSLVQIGAIAGSVTAALYTAKKVFDFSQEGAQVNQLTESFEGMNARVFQTPGLLDNMRDSVRGTVSDVDLMRNLMTLTAGTTNDVARAFADAAPQLLEIAKASNKLNPTLGTTDFLFQSIALGIKRSSPLILDNLGIVVKLEETYRNYAASVGKTTDELTAVEKQMALLNGVMAAGDRIIAQAGGTVEAQQDPWARLTVTIGEATTAGKRHMADFLLPFVQLLAGDFGRAVEEEAQGIVETATSWKVLQDELRKVAQLYEETDTAVFGKSRQQWQASRVAIIELTRSLAQNSSSYDEFISRVVAAGLPLEEFNHLLLNTGGLSRLTAEEFFELAQESQRQAESQGQMNEQMERWRSILGPVDAQTADFTNTVRDSIIEHRRWAAAVPTEAMRAFELAVQDVKAEILGLMTSADRERMGLYGEAAGQVWLDAQREGEEARQVILRYEEDILRITGQDYEFGIKVNVTWPDPPYWWADAYGGDVRPPPEFPGSGSSGGGSGGGGGGSSPPGPPENMTTGYGTGGNWSTTGTAGGNTYVMNVTTMSRAESLIQDFRVLEALAGAYR